MASSLRITQARAAPSKRGPNRADHIVRNAFDPQNRTERAFHDEREATAHRLGLEQLAFDKSGADSGMDTVEDTGNEMLITLAGQREETTLRNKQYYLNEIVSYFDGRPLASIGVAELAAFLVHLRANDKPGTKSKASSSRKWSFLHELFRYGMDTRRIRYNPMDDVAVATRRRSKANGPLVMPSAEQVKAMLTLPPLPLRRALAVSLLLGTRPSETIAIDRQDLDEDAFAFFIWKQREGDEPKTEHGYRYAPIADRLGIILEMGDGLGFGLEEGPLLVTEDGERWTYLSLQAAFYNWQIEMGWARRVGKKIVNHLTLHKLRHAFVALALWSGSPIEAIAAAMGHKDPALTQEIYAYMIAEKAIHLATWSTAQEETLS